MPQHGIRSDKARIHRQERAQAKSRVPDCRLPISITLMFLLLIVCLWSSSPAQAENTAATDFAATQAAITVDQSSPAPLDAAMPAAPESDISDDAAGAPAVEAAMPVSSLAADASPDQASVPESPAPASVEAAPDAAVVAPAAVPASTPEPPLPGSATTSAQPALADPIGATATEDEDTDGCPGCDLELICKVGDPGVYWASQDDYLDRLLSINYELINNGPGIANNTVVTGATATAGVTIASPLPDLGTLLPGESILFTLKWLIPADVTNFTTSLTICTECGKDEENNEEDDDGDDGKPEDPVDDEKPQDPEDPDDTELTNDPQTPVDDPGITVIPVPAPSSGQPQLAGAALASASLPRLLPRTGFDITEAFIFSLGLAAAALLIAAPAFRVIRIKRK